MALLYLGRSGIFACRHCYGLVYASQRETVQDRALRRADTIRSRLGWPAGIANPRGDKPSGMHWRTFDRLSREHDALAGVTMAELAQRLARVRQRLASL